MQATNDIFKEKPKAHVDLRKLFMNESRMQADAYNKTGGGFGARGLGQIRKPALDDWNQHHPDQKYSPDDLFHYEPNAKIADWYVNKRIPQMLTAFGVPDTEANRVAAYHSGAGSVAQGNIPHAYVQGYMSSSGSDDTSAPWVGK